MFLDSKLDPLRSGSDMPVLSSWFDCGHVETNVKYLGVKRHQNINVYSVAIETTRNVIYVILTTFL